jgi:hypothetical protein
MDERAAELAAMTTSAGAIEHLPEATQHRVVRWLAGTFGVELSAPVASAAAAAPAAKSAHGRKETRKQPNVGTDAAAPKTKPKSAPGFDRTINLHPTDQTSFKDFVAVKQPRDNGYEHNVLAVYWLTQIGGLVSATADQVFTCYRDVSWRLPSNLRNNLQKTAFARGWLDTTNTDQITITPQGLNFVERELPPEK